MGIRELAGDMARNTSSIWRGIADAVDPKPPKAETATETKMPVAGPAPATTAGLEERSGAMIVPLDTWTRILEQVGHVHEAGQQLADAKERAARAETENRFLHEQIKELKAQRPSTRRATKTDTPSTPPPVAATPQHPDPLGRRRDRARRRVSDWLSP